MTKVCNKCDIEKPIKEFNKDKNNKDGLSYYCKSCRKIDRKISNDKHKDVIKKHNDKYYSNNKEKIIKRVIDYQEKHKDEINGVITIKK
jgi:hypothetical protein